MVINKFSSIITVKATQVDREGGFDIFYLFKDAGFALAPDSPLLCPTGCDINEVDGINVNSGGGIAAMSYGIRLKESRATFIPLVSLYGDAFAQ
jgi:hypothetical protein